MGTSSAATDPLVHAIVDHERGPVGVASYLRIAPEQGSIDVSAAPRTAARRLGFTFGGVFRQAGVVRGRNRDTACCPVAEGWSLTDRPVRICR